MKLSFEKRVRHSAKIAMVEWLDSVGDSGWQVFDANETSKLKMISVGYIIERDQDKVVVVPHVQLDPEGLPCGMNGRLVIPMKAVTNIRILTEVKKDVSS